MMHQKRFSDLNDNINFEELEEWCERYFNNVMQIMNAFFATCNPQEVLERLRLISFESLIEEELEQELEEVRRFALKRLAELLATEIMYYEAYTEPQTGS